jgi:hypothetical protein
MPPSCTICRHPEKLAIEDLLLRNRLSLRVVAERTGVSAWALHRHKRHLSQAVIDAAQIVGANSLLARIEAVLAEVQDIATKAKRSKDWPAALQALKELRACLQLIGRVSGELPQQPTAGELHLHRHQHVHLAATERSEHELDVEIARHVFEATGGFDPREIARLKALVEGDGVPALQA